MLNNHIQDSFEDGVPNEIVRDSEIISMLKHGIESFKNSINSKLTNQKDKFNYMKCSNEFKDLQLDGEEIYAWEGQVRSKHNSIWFEVYKEILDDDKINISIRYNWDIEEEPDGVEFNYNINKTMSLDYGREGRWGWKMKWYKLDEFIYKFDTHFISNPNEKNHSTQYNLNEEYNRILESYETKADKKREIKKLITKFCQKNKLKIISIDNFSDIKDPICSFAIRIYAKPEKVPIIYSNEMFKMVKYLEDNLKAMFAAEEILRNSDFDLNYVGFDEDYFTINFYID